MASFIIWYSIVVFLLIVLLFILGLFTQFSPMILMIFMLVLLLVSFIVAAVYSGSAAARTGGKDADENNKQAHDFYVNSTIVGWVTVGVIVIAIAITIYMSAEAAVAAKALSTDTSPVRNETKSITTSQISSELSLPIMDTPEARNLNDKIAKEAKSRGFFERLSENQKSSYKAFRGFLYACLFIFIVLAILAGIYAALGSAAQQGSDSKKGLKPGTISAIINLFVAGMFIIFFIVMYARDRGLHKRLKEDIIYHHQLAMEYNSLKQANVSDAKAQIAAKYLEKYTG